MSFRAYANMQSVANAKNCAQKNILKKINMIFKKSKITYTFENLIQDYGEIPVCLCEECQIKGIKVKVNPNNCGSYINYKKKGYPKYIVGHHNKGKNNINYGKSPSEETRKKMRQALVGKSCHSQEFKNRQSERMKKENPMKIKEIALKMSESNKDRIPWNKDKSWNINIINKMSIARKEFCKLYPEKILKGENHPMYGLTGELSPTWKGGIDYLNRQIRKCQKYNEWRNLVYIRDAFTCQECGNNSGGNLEAHNIELLSIIIKDNNITTIEEALNCSKIWDINNGITLCEECHNTKPKRRNQILKNV